RLTYSALPRDSGVGEGGWAGLSFSPTQFLTVPSLCLTISSVDWIPATY
ncbi:hypothetical protein LINGRAHAP2_LOCUS32666, partial [Linum grandiflorum]